jgi:AcrR family transcriptional regulator
MSIQQRGGGAGGHSAQKRRAILDAAREVFVRRGFPGTSMDEVAAAAGVSKVTIYKHFSDKHRLFVAVFTDAIQQAEETSRSLVDQLATSDDIENDMRAFARQHITVVTQPHLVDLRRMIIAESLRFPELAKSWHRAGPEQGHATLAARIEQLDRRGLLRAPDPLLAAQHLNYLILSVPLNEAMFAARDKPYSRRQLHRFADEAVRVFMAAYGGSDTRSQLSSSRPR